MKKARTRSGIIVLTITILTTVIAAAPIMLITQSAYAIVSACVLAREGKAPIAISDNNVYVVWWGNGTGNFEVMFKASNDDGQTFGQKINLSNSTNGTSTEADVAAAGDNVYVGYLDNKSGIASAYFRASTDGGKMFGPEITLTDPAADLVVTPEMMQIEPQMKVAASGNSNVYVITAGYESINETTAADVFISVSNDGGQTFGDPVNLSNSTGIESDRAEIEASGNNVYVTWWDKSSDGKDQPMMRISADMGQTFGEVMLLTANNSTKSS